MHVQKAWHFHSSHARMTVSCYCCRLWVHNSEEEQEVPSALRDSLPRHLQPLLDTAAAEQEQDVAGSSTAARPATRLLLLLLFSTDLSRHAVPSPWQLGCTVPPALVPLLWVRYSKHVASAVLHGQAASSAHDPASLICMLEEGLAAAPTMAHVAQLASALLEAQARLHDDLYYDVEPKLQLEILRSARSALEAVRGLMTAPPAHGGATPTGAGRDGAPGCRELLAGTLAASSWLALHAVGAGRELREELLCTLRSCMAADCWTNSHSATSC
jgi:hypothetical protein